jgi:hypothetical protein
VCDEGATEHTTGALLSLSLWKKKSSQIDRHTYSPKHVAKKTNKKTHETNLTSDKLLDNDGGGEHKRVAFFCKKIHYVKHQTEK